MEEKLIELIQKVEGIAPDMWHALIARQQVSSAMGVLFGAVLTALGAWLYKHAKVEKAAQDTKKAGGFYTNYEATFGLHVGAIIAFLIGLGIVIGNVDGVVMPEGVVIRSLLP